MRKVRPHTVSAAIGTSVDESAGPHEPHLKNLARTVGWDWEVVWDDEEVVKQSVANYGRIHGMVCECCGLVLGACRQCKLVYHAQRSAHEKVPVRPVHRQPRHAGLH